MLAAAAAASAQKRAGVKTVKNEALAAMRYSTEDQLVLEKGMTLHIPSEITWLSEGISAFFMCPFTREGEEEPQNCIAVWASQFMSSRMEVDPETRKCLGMRFHSGSLKDYRRTKPDMLAYWDGLKGGKIFIQKVETISVPAYREADPYRVGSTVDEADVRSAKIYTADYELA